MVEIEVGYLRSEDDDGNDEPEEIKVTPSAAKIRECLHRLVLGFDRTEF